MKPWETLDTETSPDGARVVLCRRAGEFAIRSGGKTLMSSHASRSEVEMAALAGKTIAPLKKPRALIGGLGMGFTLRSLLSELPPGAQVHVAELLPKVVEWNRTVLAGLANHPLSDPRVTLEAGDVYEIIGREDAAWDAILLDVDNGPTPFCYGPNRRLYSTEGLALIRKALKPGGIFTLWSIDPDPQFQQRLVKAGFTVTVHRSAAYGEPGSPQRGKRHIIYFARAGAGS